jgi:cytochrome c-type biogenesis protein CcmH/NrfF
VIESPVEIARQLQDAVGKLDLKGAQNKTLREMLKGSIERGAQDSRAMLNLINKLVRQGAPSSEIVAKLVDDYNQRVNIHLREK